MKTRIAISVALPVAATMVALGGAAARADLTYQGAVGLPLNPTAQIPLQGGVRLQANYYDLGDVSTPTTSASSKLYGLYGAGRVGSGPIEISGGIQQVRNRINVLGVGASDNNTGFTLGAKYLFSRESDPAGVRIAAGLGYGDLDSFSSNGRNYHGYVVGSKYLGNLTDGRVPITAHLGARYDRYYFGSGAGRVRSNKVSAFAGVEVPIVRTGDFAFVGELQSKNISGGSTPYSASIRYRRAAQPLSASLGIQRQGLGDSGFFAQIGYSFDTKRAAAQDAEVGALGGQ